MWAKLAKFGFIALVCHVLPQGILHPTWTWDNGKFPAPDRLSQERPSVSAGSPSYSIGGNSPTIPQIRAIKIRVQPIICL